MSDKSSFSRQSWDSAADHNRCSSTSTGEDLIEVAPSPKLKRHNSLKLIRQRDIVVIQLYQIFLLLKLNHDEYT